MSTQESPETLLLQYRLTDRLGNSAWKAEDVAASILFVAALPSHVSVPELIIKPTSQLYV